MTVDGLESDCNIERMVDVTTAGSEDVDTPSTCLL